MSGGKSATAHSACLGAALRNQPAVYVLTNPKRKVRAEGMPYGVLDGREPQTLAHILNDDPGQWDIQKLCRDYGLTPYDALYVELALRTKSPLATLDQTQKTAALALSIECL